MLQEFISDLYSYRNRIGLLIGHYSISLMRAYISGACTVFWLNGDNEAYEAFDRSWREYVDVYYGLKPGDGVQGWHRLIKQHTTSEKEAIEVFYSLLEKYLKEKYPYIIIDCQESSE